MPWQRMKSTLARGEGDEHLRNTPARKRFLTLLRLPGPRFCTARAALLAARRAARSGNAQTPDLAPTAESDLAPPAASDVLATQLPVSTWQETPSVLSLSALEDAFCCTALFCTAGAGSEAGKSALSGPAS